jgi:hypothetical protein
MRGNTKLPSHIGDFVLRFNEVLRVKISIRSDSLIQVLLLLQFGLELNIFFLELTDQVLLKLNFFDHLHEVSVGARGIL